MKTTNIANYTRYSFIVHQHPGHRPAQRRKETCCWLLLFFLSRNFLLHHKLSIVQQQTSDADSLCRLEANCDGSVATQPQTQHIFAAEMRA